MAKKNITIDDLAGMVQHGFEQVDKRLNKLDQKVGNIDLRLSHVERDVAMIKNQFALITIVEFERLPGRVDYIEKKLGIKSGK